MTIDKSGPGRAGDAGAASNGEIATTVSEGIFARELVRGWIERNAGRRERLRQCRIRFRLVVQVEDRDGRGMTLFDESPEL